ncbi:MAG TPA: ABC transporter permease [Chitinophagaceae bacterium]|nr:ABC transporter permease [Chitinophagaceae bacterium]
MLTNYLKIAWRNLRKNSIYSFINIFGLTAGLTAFLLIALYIFDELTYDSFYSDVNSIYRVIEHKTSAAGKESNVVSIAYNLSEKGKKDFPEVEMMGRFSMLGRSNISNNENTNTFYESYYLGDETLLKILDLPTLQGDLNTALKEPHSVVITEETAIKIFGDKNAIGKAIRMEGDSIPYKITAVVNIPNNSHLSFNLLFSESTLYSAPRFMDFLTNDWTSNSFVTYVKLKDGAKPQQTAANLENLAKAHRQQDAAKSSFYLQALKDIHFYSSDIEGNLGSAGNITHMYVFGIVGLFVLIIACINYMNLTTARFAGRSKEIAVRKVAGADKKNLISQFLAESMLVTIIALLLAFAAVKLLLPAFNAFTEKELTLGSSTDYRIWLGIFAITVLVGLLAGLYPAFFQSRLKPFLLLKNKIEAGKGHLSLRRALVVFQFSLSIIMIIATLIVHQQLKYVSNKDMGFNKDQLLVVDINSGAVRRSAETIKTEYAKLAGVKSVSATSRVPGEWKVMPKVKVKAPGQPEEGESMYYIAVDDQFLKTFQVLLVTGRNFSAANAADSAAVMINESAAKMLGISTPSEQLIEIPSVDFSGNVSQLSAPFRARVVGIVKDFNFQSLREKIAPMVLAYQRNPVHNIDYFTARITADNPSALLKQMEDVLRKIDERHLFEYNFLDKQWELFYREDEKRQIIFMGVALLTILIACLGLLGLATYAAQQRIKEIGIRKVLGASVTSIVSMLSKDFLQLVLVAAVIAFPVAWWAMSTWLEDFAYRVNVQWWVFAIAAGAALLIALCTVSFQAIKAALSNPVKSLRTE